MMSTIMPAGEKRFDWAPGGAEEKMVKTASAGDHPEATEEVVEDALLAAARGFVESQSEVADEATEEVVTAEKECKKCDKCDKDCCDKCGKGCDCDDCDCPAEASADKPVVEAMYNENSEVIEIGEGAEEAPEAPVDEVEEAVEDLKEAVEKIEEAVGCGEGEGEEGTEVSEVSDDEIVEVEVEIEPQPEEEELVIESVEGCGSSFAGSEEGNEVTASSADRFVSYAMISPAVRKRLRKFWDSDLDYASDYVDLMLKDYEK